ncbi:hypothetical protein [Halalkalicoccus salilacus]|uniref:hypothetical protein n=1 Tax=Halalkalicoccus salilacus TaxID=3117459 RepID=UPI00300E81F5
MRTENEIRDRLDEVRDSDAAYDEFEEAGEAIEAEHRGYVEALAWVLEERNDGEG